MYLTSPSLALKNLVTILFIIINWGAFASEESAANNYTGTIPGKLVHNVTVLKSYLTQIIVGISCLPHGYGWGWSWLSCPHLPAVIAVLFIAVLFVTWGSTLVGLRARFRAIHLGCNPGTMVWRLHCRVSSFSQDDSHGQHWKSVYKV